MRHSRRNWLRRQLALLLAQVVPQLHAARGSRSPRRGTGGAISSAACRCLGRALARVLDRQRGGDHHHLADAAVALGLEHHPAEPGVDRQARQAAAERRQPALPASRRARARARRAPRAARTPSRIDAAVGRFDERERGDVAEAERGHLQDDRREVGAQDLGLGELRPLRRSRPRRTAGCRCPARRGRSARRAGWPTPARPARSAAAAPSSRWL